MRHELKPNIKIAEKLFPDIIKLLENYVNDDNGDLLELENKLKELTGKNIKKYYLSSWLEEDENDDIAFVLSVPENNNKYENITKDELYEIISFMKLYSNKTMEETENEKSKNKTFEEKYKHKLVGYYNNILENNFKRYDDKLLYKQKDKNGKETEYSIEEIIKKIK
jgi:hypothetical protein